MYTPDIEGGRGPREVVRVNGSVEGGRREGRRARATGPLRVRLFEPKAVPHVVHRPRLR